MKKLKEQADYTRLSNGLIDIARPTNRQNYTITDFFSNYEEINAEKIAKVGRKASENAEGVKRSRNRMCSTIRDIFNVTNFSHWLFLILMAMFTTLLSISIDMAIKYTVMLRLYLTVDLGLSFIPAFVIWIGFTLFFTMIAACVGEYISKDAEGSGIPEMKSILAGVNIYRYLSFQTVIGKVIGLYSGFAAGLAIGKEGPFVHLAGGITNKLSKLKPFHDIKNNHSLRKQMIASSVA